MFGQRHKASLSCNMMTLKEWSAHFPELLAFVSQKLEGGLQGGDSITGVQPSLFLILTLLASLGPAAESNQCHRLCVCVCVCVCVCAVSYTHLTLPTKLSV